MTVGCFPAAFKKAFVRPLLKTVRLNAGDQKGSQYILRRPCRRCRPYRRSRPVINAGGRRCRAAGECGCCDMSIFLNSHTRLLSAQRQLQWSIEQTCHQSQRRRVLAALITTADGAGHPKSAALIVLTLCLPCVALP